MITIGGEPAVNAAPSRPTTVKTAVTSSHPYAKAGHRKVRLVKVSRPQDARLKPGHAAAPRRAIPLLVPPSRSAKGRAGDAPRVAATKVVAKRGASVLANFDGVSAIDNKTAAAFDLEPPDEGLGAGHGFVVNFVNVTGAVYDTRGAVVQPPFFLNTFFGEPADANTSDPRVYFDANVGRWFATMLAYSFTEDGTAIAESHLDVAASDSSDPTDSWHVYRVDASSPTHGGCPCLGDYPILGVDGTNVYVSTQEFTGDLQSYNGAQLYILPVSELVAGRSSVHLATFENLQADGSLAFRVQFANEPRSAPAELAMSTIDWTGDGDNRVVVWAVTHRKALARGRMPALSSRVISTEGYFPAPPTQTPPGYCDACDAPTSGLVDSGPDAMYETQFLHGKLVGALATGVNVAGDSAPRAGIGWLVVAPRVRHGQVTGGTRVQRQGYLASNGLGLLYPHVNMTANGSMAMAMGLGGPGTYLSAATSVAPRGGRFGPIRMIAPGVTTDNGFTGTEDFGGVGRWGDYSNGQVIPGTNRVWLATQYIPGGGDANANWGNRIWQLKIGR